MATNYNEQLAEEIRQVPQEHLPALLNIVHSFRESVGLKDDMLDQVKCREAIDVALSTPEPQQAFDRQSWLNSTKAQLRQHDQ
ncbi:MAG: hypothetical protein CSA49_03700 [Gammaproteobacteria bacterium]|nr:MAG: hypothetical protein CSA49_03700 [Gammaproteobacteria bacterium]